jgi:antitoxin YefM
MAIETTTYSEARANLETLLDEVIDSREPVIIRRPGAEDVALIAADELRSLLETVHLLHSPKNAQRLLDAFRRARAGEGTPETIDELRAELALNDQQ